MEASRRGFGAPFWALMVATFLGFLGMGTVLPLLAPHVRFELGGSDQDVGYVVGIFSFVALLGRLLSGPVADTRGRKAALLAGLACCGGAGAIYLLPIGLPGPYLARTLQGLGEAFLFTGAVAWAVELVGVDRSARALGYVSSGIWGGLSAGPVVGQYLGSFRNAALMQVVTAAAAFALLLCIREDYHPEPHRTAFRWRSRRIIGSGIAIGLVNAQYPVLSGFLVLHLQTHGNSGPMAFATYAGLVLTTRLFLGGLPDRIEPYLTYFGGIICMAAALLILASAPSPVVAVTAAALLGFGYSFPWASLASTILKDTPRSERASVVGILSAFRDLFIGSSSFAAGLVAHHFSYAATFVMAAAALAGAAVMGRVVFFPPAVERREAAVAK